MPPPFDGFGVHLRKTTLVDYPGRVAAALFLPGCGLRCPWCQNRDLVLPGAGSLSPLGDALAHIRKRRAVLGGVVISGGEPSGHPALAPLVAELHGLGLPVKLDTNGMSPEVLRELFKNPRTRPDYVALDLKIAPERYADIMPRGKSRPDPGAALRESAALAASAAGCEFRSLVLPDGFFGPADVEALAPLVPADGPPWYFRRFSPGNCLDPAWDDRDPPPAERVGFFVEAARKLGRNASAP